MPLFQVLTPPFCLVYDSSKNPIHKEQSASMSLAHDLSEMIRLAHAHHRSIWFMLHNYSGSKFYTFIQIKKVAEVYRQLLALAI